MVQPDEVRVGNRFKDVIVDEVTLTGIIYILSVDEKGRPVRVIKKDFEDLEPIPLTPEILRVCGKENEELIFHKHHNEKNMWIIDINNENRYFQFLHELQNIYEDIFEKQLLVPIEL